MKLIKISHLGVVLALQACSAIQQSPSPASINFHIDDLRPVEIGSLANFDYETPDLKAMVDRMLSRNLFPPSDSPSCGGVILLDSELSEPKVKFNIVSVTEQYVPITGEIKGLVFHVRMQH